MGIRYYAYPVSPREIEAARENPCAFHGDDPLMDAWGPVEERPPMLYLDKCWTCLQRLFDVDSDHPRPAAELVRGDVTMTELGWIPYERVLDPDEVAAIADDVERFVSDGDLIEPVPCRFASCDALRAYLEDAKDFLSDLRAAHYGLVYLIG